MIAQSFYPSNYSELKSWYESHNLEAVRITALPQVGFIVPGIAAGFLYKTDSDVCLLEGFVTNPKAPAEERNQALDAIVEELVMAAKFEKFKEVYAISKDFSVIARAQKFGFNHTGNLQMLSKGI